MKTKRHYLTESENGPFQQRLASGSASLSVPRSVARQVFTRVPNKSIIETTGRSMWWQKLAIWTSMWAGGVLFVLTLLAVIYYFEWMSALGVPLVGSFWVVVAGLTSDRGTWVHGVVGTVAGLSLAAILPVEFQVPLALFTGSICLQRVAYLLSQYWVTVMVSTSFPAYDMMVEHIEVEDPQFNANRD